MYFNTYVNTIRVMRFFRYFSEYYWIVYTLHTFSIPNKILWGHPTLHPEPWQDLLPITVLRLKPSRLLQCVSPNSQSSTRNAFGLHFFFWLRPQPPQQPLAVVALKYKPIWNVARVKYSLNLEGNSRKVVLEWPMGVRVQIWTDFKVYQDWSMPSLPLHQCEAGIDEAGID